MNLIYNHIIEINKSEVVNLINIYNQQKYNIELFLNNFINKIVIFRLNYDILYKEKNNNYKISLINEIIDEFKNNLMSIFLNDNNFSLLYDNKISIFLDKLYTNITLNLFKLIINNNKFKYNLYNDCILISQIYI